jgi:hypothetical protein
MTRTLRLLFIVSMLALPLAGCTAQGGFHIHKVGGVPPKESDWSRVAGLERISTIRITLKGGRPVNRDFVMADESELVSLHLTDSTLPRQVRRALRNLALDRPIDLFKVSHGQSLIEGRVRLGPDGVFLDGRKIVALEQAVERAARNDIAEISWVHRATPRGFGWGALIGAGIGLAVTFAACGTNWSQETSSCSNLTPILVFVGPLYGTLIGGAVGAGSKISTVVYRAP